jgi:hypothetical protein
MKRIAGVVSVPYWSRIAGAVVGCAIAGATPASSASFVAQATHGGLVVTPATGSAGRLVPNGMLHRSGEPTYVYGSEGNVVAGVWQTAPDAAVVRGGTTADGPLIGRIVPSWKDNALQLTIETAQGPTVQSSVFQRDGGAGPSTLDRDTMSRVGLEGKYRATLRSAGGKDAGWLMVDVDPEGGTRFSGDFPPDIPPSLAAAAAEAVNMEVAFIYGNADDVRARYR